jgi:hypothetical protein
MVVLPAVTLPQPGRPVHPAVVVALVDILEQEVLVAMVEEITGRLGLAAAAGEDMVVAILRPTNLPAAAAAWAF